MELNKDIRRCGGVVGVEDEPFCAKKLPTNPDVAGCLLYHLEIKKYIVKKAMSATCDEIVGV